MARPIEEPLVEQTGRGTRSTHPAFGQISASRVHGHATLYGSDFNHQHSICIRISTSALERDLARDWAFKQKEFVEVELSESQWATFVSSLNMGDGVQCTIRHINREVMPGLPDPIDKREMFRAEASKETLDALQDMKDLEELIDQSNLTKKAKDQLKWKVESARRGISSSVEFIAMQFDEHMETTVAKAKSEVHAYTNHAVTSLGLDALNTLKLTIQTKEDDGTT